MKGEMFNTVLKPGYKLLILLLIKINIYDYKF